VVIHSGANAPSPAYATARYGRTWFWIDENDFDSKLAFSVLQVLLAMARTSVPPGAVLTIPTH
jgi:hypothetical protein